jgi:hypothetical protein
MTAAKVLRWIGLAGGVAALLPACGSTLGPRDDAGADGQLCSLPPNCAGYCNHLVAKGCDFPQTPIELTMLCTDECSRQHDLVPADCMVAWTNVMACAACASVQCPRKTCTPDGTVCIDEGIKVVGCETAQSEFEACSGACLKDSLVEGGSFSEGSYELTTSGCVCPATLRAGKAAGEPCTSESECAEVCCGCSNSRGKFVVRACKNGVCLGDPGICTEMIGFSQFGAC